jgi:iron complex outermembrane receptor protein
VSRALLFAALLGGASGIAAAQQANPSADAADSRDQMLGEVVVTAQRRTENIQTVPIAISALEGAALADRNMVGLQDISSTVPSVNIQNRRSSGVVTIRGIGFEVATAGADPAVAVHTDGVYVARPPAALTNLFDIERIEVARGPQGTLYGRNATGGALNIVTRKPTSEAEGSLDLSYGNYNAILAEGALSGPLGSDAVLGRIAFQYNKRDGFGENRFLGTDINDWDSFGVRAQLQLAATENLSFLLSGEYYSQDDNAFTPTFAGFAAPCVTTPPGRRCGTAYGGQVLQDNQDVLFDFETINERDTTAVALTAEYVGGPFTLRSITGYRKTDYRWEVDGDETTFDIGFVGRDENADQISEEIQLLGETERLKWLIGGFYFTEDNDALGYADIPVPDFRTLIIRQFGNLETDAWALFGQATWSFNDRWALTVGGRYSDEEKTLNAESSQQLPGVIPAPRPSRSESWSKFTPKATLEYTHSDDLFLYVSAQQGFKSGGYAAGALTPPFNPEEVWSYELGMKSTWADGRVRANLAVFHYEYKDLQVGFVQNIPGGAVITVVTNAAQASNTGLEAELVARVTDAFTIEANLSFMDAKFDDYVTVDPNRPALGALDLSGNKLAQAPDFTGFLAAEYEWPLASGSVSLRGEYNYTDKIFFDAYNREGIMSQDGYGLANAFLTFNSGGNWRLSAFARNLFDEEYRVGSAIAGAIWGSPVLSIPGAPRTFGVRASFSF